MKDKKLIDLINKSHEEGISLCLCLVDPRADHQVFEEQLWFIEHLREEIKVREPKGDAPPNINVLRVDFNKAGSIPGFSVPVLERARKWCEPDTVVWLPPNHDNIKVLSGKENVLDFLRTLTQAGAEEQAERNRWSAIDFAQSIPFPDRNPFTDTKEAFYRVLTDRFRYADNILVGIVPRIVVPTMEYVLIYQAFSRIRHLINNGRVDAFVVSVETAQNIPHLAVLYEEDNPFISPLKRDEPQMVAFVDHSNYKVVYQVEDLELIITRVWKLKGKK